MGLLPFSREAVKKFTKVEAPEDSSKRHGAGIYSIGQLYEEVRNLLTEVTVDLTEAVVFSGKPERQFSNEEYYGAGGRVTVVRGLNDALGAAEEIAQQGEGRVNSVLTGDDARFGQPKEVAHYYRFKQILAGRLFDRDDDVRAAPSGPRLIVDWRAVHPVESLEANAPPTMPNGLNQLLQDFEQTYCTLLTALHRAFNGDKPAINDAVPIMQQLKSQAVQIMKVPIGDGRTCAPPFWFIRS